MAITLAIVEDLDEVRDGLKNFISLSHDFKVLDTFKTAEEAAYDLPKLKPDIVIMDINLPGMNGIECIRQIKDKTPRTQFMMFTVYENDEKVFEVADNLDSGFRANLVEQKSRVSMVNRAIALLSTDDAEIITLFYKAEQNLEEIGRILRIEPNTVKVRLHRARTRLKEKMEKHFSEEVKNIY
jgi:RNA polymerase sigma factor (sigma-70 family)